jgi:hypothetical protein
MKQRHRRTALVTVTALALAAGTLLTPTLSTQADPLSPSTGARIDTTSAPVAAAPGRVFYVSAAGNDAATGLTPATAWRSLARVTAATFAPGDVVAFRRGETFLGSATIAEAGTSANPITVTAYGTGSQPILTNPGQLNMLVLDAPRIHVRNLAFADGAVFDNTDGLGISGYKYRLSGAVAITSNGSESLVQDSTFTDVGIGVKSYGADSVINHNTFADLRIAFRGTDTGGCNCSTSYGAVGVSANNNGIDITWNDFINARSTDSPYGADGGAIEIEGFDHTKNDIQITHNYSRGSQGFLEVTETTSSNVTISQNVSDDYQQFVAWDTTTTPSGYKVFNNTVVRRNDSSRLVDQYYYRVPGPAPTATWATFTNNIFFSNGAYSFHEFPHVNNLFKSISQLQTYALGAGDLVAAPRFVNYESGDLRLMLESPAVDNGSNAVATGATDLAGTARPAGTSTDIGAFELSPAPIAGSNVTADSGFETQTSLGTATTPWSTEGNFSYGVDVAANKAHTGADNGWITTGTSTSWGAIRQQATVSANSTYRLTVWVRTSPNFTQGWIGARTTSGTVLSEVRHGAASAGYTRYIVDVPTGTATTIRLYAGMYGPGSSAWEQLDDIMLQKLN